MTAPPSVWVVGAGGHGKVVTAILQSTGVHVAALVTDGPVDTSRTVLGRPVEHAEPDANWIAAPNRRVIVAIGDNKTRRAIAQRLEKAQWTQAIHPSAVVHPSARIGPGAMICANAVIQPDAFVGAHVIINTGAIVEHDCFVGDYCHLAPRSCLAGSVRVEEGSFLGVGVSVIPGISIGTWCTIGAGSVVIRDVPPGATVVGVPGRVLRIANNNDDDA
jgi:sugar O-acyltransferase (sialic acid O-acetyltransferase NeuD family)